MDDNRLNSILNGLVRAKHEQQLIKEEAATSADNEYQTIIDQANAKSESVEFLRDFRAAYLDRPN